MQGMIKKVVIIGPESTGKSTLCEQLAAHYQTSWVREYARQYLETNGTNYNFDDLSKIAAGQIEGEDIICNSIQSATLACGVPVFIDTDLYVIKVWSEIAFNKCDNNILTQIAKRPYDLYLLCNTDLPWVKDSLREYPDLHTRETIYQHYLDVMVHQQTEWTAINGNYEERLATAIKAVDQLCALS